MSDPLITRYDIEVALGEGLPAQPTVDALLESIYEPDTSSFDWSRVAIVPPHGHICHSSRRPGQEKTCGCDWHD